jgi:hypothetical protein
MATDGIRAEDFMGVVESVRAIIRARIKEGSLKDGDTIDLAEIAPTQSAAHVARLVEELRPYSESAEPDLSYRGAILTKGETSERVPEGARYSFTHGTSTRSLILHIHPPT